MSFGSVTEVPGVLVGSAAVPGGGSGVTVVLPPPGSHVGVDSRGGAPATHETDILAPGTLSDTADAILLTGGSALGLSSVAGVVDALIAEGRGFPVPETTIRVPLVPAAAIFDLGRTGDPSAYPRATCAAEAVRLAGPEVARGSAGAGAGALMGRGLLKGGQGTASVRAESGHVVGALAVANPVGLPCDADARLHAATYASGGAAIPAPTREESERWRAHVAASGRHSPGRNTTIGVVATDAALTPAQVTRFAQAAHAGLARAIHPSHTIADGDTIFSVATGEGPPPSDEELFALGVAAADAFMLAVADAALAAQAREGFAPPYASFAPSVVAGLAPA